MVRAIFLVLLALQQAPAPADSRIASVQVKGTRRYTPEEVTRLSGVEIGKTMTPADLSAAAARLAATGLFDSVRYVYSTGRNITVTFDVEEAKWTMPVILDNFVWLPDEELIAAVRKDVPSFDGTAPLNAGAGELITQSLQGILKARGIPGRVEFIAQADMRGGDPKYLFSVRDPSPKICALHVKGTSGISEADLLSPLQAVKGGDYSKFFLQSASAGTLLDMYRRKGYLAAKFGAPLPAVDKCDGVDVTLQVDEGIAFTFDHAEWTGNQAVPSEALTRALGMKAGEIADASKIDAGLRDVHRLYGKQGFLAQRATPEPRLDAAARKAVAAIAVHEGPQFHMGTIRVEGVREADAAALAKKWTLKPGDVFDESYVVKFQVEELSALRTSAGGRPQLQTEVDRAQNVVNVKIIFK